MSVLTELADRCAIATGSDRELDAQIWLAITPGATRKSTAVKSSKGLWPDYDIDETRENGRLIIVPGYTASIDAAMALVPGDYRLHSLGETAYMIGGPWLASLITRDEDAAYSGPACDAPTAPLALCGAALLAIAKAIPPAPATQAATASLVVDSNSEASGSASEEGF